MLPQPNRNLEFQLHTPRPPDNLLLQQSPVPPDSLILQQWVLNSFKLQSAALC